MILLLRVCCAFWICRLLSDNLGYFLSILLQIYFLPIPGQRRKERYIHFNAEFQIARRDKKAFLRDQCKEIEDNNRMERLEISSRKLEIPREYFMQRCAKKGQK